MKTKKTKQIKLRRQRRVRAKILGTEAKPRLSVFRSNLYIYAQLIDDVACKTLVSASSIENKKKKMKKIGMAEDLGKMIAEKAKKIGVEKAVFDRGSYRYHGRVKAMVEAARKEGLKI